MISWLSQHNFPHGLVWFADGLSTDPLKHKAEYLKHLQNDVINIFNIFNTILNPFSVP